MLGCDMPTPFRANGTTIALGALKGTFARGGGSAIGQAYREDGAPVHLVDADGAAVQVHVLDGE